MVTWTQLPAARCYLKSLPNAFCSPPDTLEFLERGEMVRSYLDLSDSDDDGGGGRSTPASSASSFGSRSTDSVDVETFSPVSEYVSPSAGQRRLFWVRLLRWFFSGIFSDLLGFMCSYVTIAVVVTLACHAVGRCSIPTSSQRMLFLLLGLILGCWKDENGVFLHFHIVEKILLKRKCWENASYGPNNSSILSKFIKSSLLHFCQ